MTKDSYKIIFKKLLVMNSVCYTTAFTYFRSLIQTLVSFLFIQEFS